MLKINTAIFELTDGQKGIWKRLSAEHNSRFGSVWQNGQTLYYFDNLGDSQLIDHSIYRIADEMTGKLLQQREVNPQIINKLLRENKLLTVSKKELLCATTNYERSFWKEFREMLFL